VEHVEVGHALAVGGEHDRFAGDPGDRQRRAAAGVTVQLGQHHAVETDAVGERLGGVHRILADHRVHDEQDLSGIHRVPDVGRLLHQVGVDAQPAGGVDDHHVVELAHRVQDRAARHLDGVAHTVARLGGEDMDAGPLADDLQLVDRVGALEVRGHEQRAVPLLLQPFAELAGQSRLAGALEAGEHDHRRRSLGEPQRTGLAAEDADQLVVDDLDDLLAGVERLMDLGAVGTLLDRGDEVLDDAQVDVGLQERQSDLPGGGVDVGVGQLGLAAEVAESRGQTVLQGVEQLGSF